MALIGNLDTNFGLNANYHNIKSFTWIKNDRLSISVSSFIDQQSRLLDKQPLTVSNFIFSSDMANNQLSMADLYAKLKTLLQFNAMIDG